MVTATYSGSILYVDGGEVSGNKELEVCQNKTGQVTL